MSAVSLTIVSGDLYDTWLYRSRHTRTADGDFLGADVPLASDYLEVDHLGVDLPAIERSGVRIVANDDESLRRVLAKAVRALSPTYSPGRDTAGTILMNVWRSLFALATLSPLITLLHPPAAAISPLWAQIVVAIVSAGLLTATFLVRSPFPGYLFEFPSLNRSYDYGFSKASLRRQGIVEGDLIVVRRDDGVPGALAFWGNLTRGPKFWVDRLDDFLWHAIVEHRGSYNIHETVMDSKHKPTPPCVGAVVLYTEQDWAVARYVRLNFAPLHFMSGLLLTLYVFEEKPPDEARLSRAREFWAARLPRKWFRVWSALHMTVSKPYSNEAIYHFCQQMNVDPDALPCVLLFRDWKKVKAEREIILIDGELEVFFRRFCSDVARALQSTVASDLPFELCRDGFWGRFSERWRERVGREDAIHPMPERPWRNSVTPSAFLCHSSADHAFVEKLARDLRAVGTTVWLDRWEIRVGDSIIEKIQQGLGEQDFLILVLSPDAISSDWVRKELRHRQKISDRIGDLR